MAETNAAKFKPLILAPTQSAIPLSSYLLIADPSELPFAQRVEYAARGERQPLGMFARMGERLAEVVSGRPNVESSWAKAMTIADKKLTAIGFEPAKDTEKMPIELGSVGSLSRARMFMGWIGFFRAMSVDLEALATKTADTETISRAIRGFGAPVSMGGIAYTPSLFGKGSDRVHLHVNGPHRTDDLLVAAGDVLAKSGFGEKDDKSNLPVGQALGLLHESFHMVQDRDAWKRGVHAIVPQLDFSKLDAPGDMARRALMSHIESVAEKAIDESKNAVRALRQKINRDNDEKKVFTDAQKENGVSEKDIERMWSAKSANKEPERRRNDRALFFTKLLNECFADIMASVALGEGEPLGAAKAARAVNEWRTADIELREHSRKSNVNFFAKKMMSKVALKGDEHQTEDALRFFAELASALPAGIKPSMAQWAETARSCALAGVLHWSLEASQRPAPSEELMQTRGRRATREERSMLDGELARESLFAVAQTGVGDELMDKFESEAHSPIRYNPAVEYLVRGVRKNAEAKNLESHRHTLGELETLAIANAKAILESAPSQGLSSLRGFAARRGAVQNAGGSQNAFTERKSAQSDSKKNKNKRR